MTGSSRKDSKSNYRSSGASWATQTAISDVRPALTFLFLGIYIVFFLAVAIYMTTVKLPVKVVGSGRLTSSKQPVPIKSSVDFIVGNVYVAENAKVRKGQLLVSSRENLGVSQKQILKSYLDRIDSLIRMQTEAVCRKCGIEVDLISAEYLKIGAQGPVQEILVSLNDQLQKYASASRNWSQLETNVTDLRFDIQISEGKLKRIREKNAEAILAREVEELQRTISTSKTRIAERYQTAKQATLSELEQLRSRHSEVTSKLALSEKTFNVKAPFDGTISNLRLKGEGELLIPNQVLMDITPLDVQIIARIEIRNEDISSVKKGADVILTVDALPESKYGSLKGKVSEILRLEETETDTAGTRSTKGYPVLVTLEAQSLSFNDEKAELIIGMSTQARVVSEYATLLQTFIKTIFQFRDKAGL